MAEPKTFMGLVEEWRRTANWRIQHTGAADIMLQCGTKLEALVKRIDFKLLGGLQVREIRRDILGVLAKESPTY